MQFLITSFHFIDKKKDKTILYLHGWNASYQTLLPLTQNLEEYNELFLDLPGCGKHKDPKEPLMISDYITIIKENFSEQIDKITFIVGHSFGGKLAVKLANHLPNLKGLFLISPSILKGKRSFKYYYKVLKYKFCKKLHLNTKNMGSEDYKNASLIMKKTLVNIVNEDGRKEIKILHCPTLLIWGNKDMATPIYMAYKIKKTMKNCEVIEIQGDHFAYLNKKNHVKEILTYFIKGVEKNDCS